MFRVCIIAFAFLLVQGCSPIPEDLDYADFLLTPRDFADSASADQEKYDVSRGIWGEGEVEYSFISDSAESPNLVAIIAFYPDPISSFFGKHILWQSFKLGLGEGVQLSAENECDIPEYETQCMLLTFNDSDVPALVSLTSIDNKTAITAIIGHDYKHLKKFAEDLKPKLKKLKEI